MQRHHKDSNFVSILKNRIINLKKLNHQFMLWAFGSLILSKKETMEMLEQNY